MTTSNYTCSNLDITCNKLSSIKTHGSILVSEHPGEGTLLQEPNGDVPLDGVAFSRLE